MTTAEPGTRPQGSDGPGGGAPAEAGGPFADWNRVVVWWDVALYLTLGLVVLAMTTAPSARWGRALIVQLACVAVIALAYALFGARAARTRAPAPRWTYLTVLVAATTAAMANGGASALLLFVAFTHGWMLSERRREGAVVTAVLTLGTFLAFWSTEGWSTTALPDLAAEIAVIFAFSIGLGLWVARTMRQAEENARLLGELRAAQAELAATQHAAGVAAERERVAREIHDTLAQGFMSVVTHAQVAVADLDDGDTGAARERLGTIEDTARENLAEARGLVAAFAPVSLQGSTLADALHRLAGRWSYETGIRAVVDVEDVGSLAASEEVVLLRAAQEALTNVRRHAGANEVRLSLEGGGDAPIQLTVADDGDGIPAGVAAGFGLLGMRARVTAAGGSLDVGPGADGGTVLTVRLPGRDETASGPSERNPT